MAVDLRQWKVTYQTKGMHTSSISLAIYLLFNYVN